MTMGRRPTERTKALGGNTDRFPEAAFERHRPILVTGAHRSGTTWVGRMIALSPRVGYIHEPFNIAHRPGTCAIRIDHWYTYLTEENESRFIEPLSRTVMFSYDLGAELRAVRSPRDALRALRDGSRFCWHRLLGSRPLIKDPIAVFSAEWLAERFDMDVVVLIRHPAGMASSLKRWQMPHPFADFVAQERLMQERLAPFRAEIHEHARYQHPLAEQAALLWRLVYSSVEDYRRDHPDWQFVRHEDLSRDPVSGFGRIYARLGLEMPARVRGAIARHSHPGARRLGRPSTMDDRLSRGGKMGIHRDSQEVAESWRRRLTQREIETVRNGVRGVAESFYSDADW